MKLRPQPSPKDRRDFAEFKRIADMWLKRLGLQDWNVAFNLEEQSETRMASISMNGDTRRALITLRFGADRSSSLEYLALHEVIHLLVADLCTVTGQRGDAHVDSIREEHRLIERLLPVLLEERT